MGLPQESEDKLPALTEPQEAPPVTAAPGQAPAQPVQQPAPTQPMEAQPTPAAPPAVAPEAAAPQNGPIQPKTAAQVAQEMTDHDLQFQQDLAMGKIQPKTYRDLVGDSLGGRIGTFFGLLVSGAGAGLTHQPNALLAMMDKEIDRDIERQKYEKSSAQNWYKLHRENEKQKYEQQLLQMQTLAAAGQNYAHATDADLNVARMQTLKDVKVDLRATNSAKNTYMLLQLQQQQDAINRLPAGPIRDAQQRTLDQVKQGTNAKIIENNLGTAQKEKLLDAMPIKAKDGKKTDQTQEDGGDIDYKKLNSLKMGGRSSAGLGLPADFSESDYNKSLEEAKHVENNRKAAKIYHDVFSDLNKKMFAGSLNPEDYKTQTQMAQSKISQLLGNSSKVDVTTMFPSWKDLAGKEGIARKDKYKTTMNLFEQNEVTPMLDSHKGIKKDYPKFPSPFEAEKKDPQIEKFAKDHNLDYKRAYDIIQKRKSAKK